ncbi:MFS transporter [Pseudomonas gingeri]|uniref:MFS transporter n=1 Tax=Pseudomonas gingeri TaxID=117681 RepID=A0A7Y7X9F3_9PSED|nr:MFS transporter [Pseudomonas gingeri]NWB95744.1 MFS transporter [Pseudomonas gingeri]
MSKATDGTFVSSGYGWLARIMLSIFAGNTAMYVVNLAILQVLLPTRVESLDSVHKVEILGMVTGIAAIVAIIANPLAGMLSDRTVGKFGRRTPWIVTGAIAVFATLAYMAEQQTVFGIVLGMCLLQASMNTYQSAIFAVVPDRVPSRWRGLASSMMGLAFPAGSIVGTAIASRFVGDTSGYYLLGGIMLATAILFVLLNPDTAVSRGAKASRVSLIVAVRQFFSALSHRDFFWVFFSRLMMVIAFMSLAGYQFYLLKDFIKLPEDVSPTQALVSINIFAMMAMAASTLLGGVVSDWLGKRRFLVFISAMCMSCAAVIPFIYPTYNGMLAFGILNSLGFGCYMAVDAALATEVLPDPTSQARDLGIMNIASAAAQVVSPLIASLIIVHLGGYASLLICSASFALLSALSVYGVKGVK